MTRLRGKFMYNLKVLRRVWWRSTSKTSRSTHSVPQSYKANYSTLIHYKYGQLNFGWILSANTIYEIETVDETHWNVTETKSAYRVCVSVCVWRLPSHMCESTLFVLFLTKRLNRFLRLTCRTTQQYQGRRTVTLTTRPHSNVFVLAHIRDDIGKAKRNQSMEEDKIIWKQRTFAGIAINIDVNSNRQIGFAWTKLVNNESSFELMKKKKPFVFVYVGTWRPILFVSIRLCNVYGRPTLDGKSPNR